MNRRDLFKFSLGGLAAGLLPKAAEAWNNVTHFGGYSYWAAPAKPVLSEFTHIDLPPASGECVAYRLRLHGRVLHYPACIMTLKIPVQIVPGSGKSIRYGLDYLNSRGETIWYQEHFPYYPMTVAE